MDGRHIFPTNWKFHFPEKVDFLGTYTNTINVLAAAGEWLVEFWWDCKR